MCIGKMNKLSRLEMLDASWRPTNRSRVIGSHQ